MHNLNFLRIYIFLRNFTFPSEESFWWLCSFHSQVPNWVNCYFTNHVLNLPFLSSLSIGVEPPNFFLAEYGQAGTKVGPDQRGPPVRVGSTRINSDRLGSSRITKKHKIKRNMETLTHLKAKYRLKMGHIKKDSRRFSVSRCVVKPPFCILSTSSSHRLPKLQIRGVCHSLCIQTIVWENSFLKCVANLSLVPISKAFWRLLVDYYE